MSSKSSSRAKFERKSVNQFSHTWSIENFGEAYQKEYKEDYCILSEKFFGADRNWIMSIQANQSNSFKLTGLYLHLYNFKEGETSVKLSWTISFLDENGKVIKTVNENFNFEDLVGRGNKEVIDESLFKKNDLNIRVDATEDLGNLNYTLKQNLEQESQGSFNKTGEVAIDIYATKETGRFSDFEIVASDGKSYPVHKFILAARSEYFNNLLKSGMKEDLEGKIFIEKFPAGTVGRMIDYFYAGEIKKPSPTLEELFELFSIADKYLLEGLKEICENEIKSMANLNNATQIHILARDYSAENVKNFINDYCLKNLDQMKELDLFQSEALKRPNDFIEFFIPKKQKMI